MLNDVPRASDFQQPPWNEARWRSLLLAIRFKMCTPFLGAGASSEVLPLGSEIARRWAKQYGYPFLDRSNLVRVSQYMAVLEGANLPKLLIREEFERRGLPDFGVADEPHRVLAGLPFPVYITTNYDDFMVQALEHRGRRPTRVVCNWHRAGRREPALDEGTEILRAPTPQNPLVFHLHGVLDEADSMVLTEDDYIDFLANMSEERELMPRPVMDAISLSTLMFMGYSLEDLNFKVLFRRLARYIRRDGRAHHVAVQLEPKGDEPTPEEIGLARAQRRYLEEKYRLWNINFFWSSCNEFAAELRRRWEESEKKEGSDVH